MADTLIDTNLLNSRFAQASRGYPPAQAPQAEGELHILIVTRTEILAGMHPQEGGAHDGPAVVFVEQLAGYAASVDQAGAWIYAYARRGIQLSVPDAIIAATAFAHGCTL